MAATTMRGEDGIPITVAAEPEHGTIALLVGTGSATLSPRECYELAALIAETAAKVEGPKP